MQDINPEANHVKTECLDGLFEDIASGKVQGYFVGWIDSQGHFHTAWSCQEGKPLYLSMLGLMEQIKDDYLTAKKGSF